MLTAKTTSCNKLIMFNVADVGWEGLLRNLTSTQPELGSDITSLTITADTSHSGVVHISITDLHNERWHVPASLFSSSGIGELITMLLPSALLLHCSTSS